MLHNFQRKKKTFTSSVSEDLKHLQCKSHLPSFVSNYLKCLNLSFICKLWSTLMNKLFIYNNFPFFLHFDVATNNNVVLWDKTFESPCIVIRVICCDAFTMLVKWCMPAKRGGFTFWSIRQFLCTFMFIFLKTKDYNRHYIKKFKDKFMKMPKSLRISGCCSKGWKVWKHALENVKNLSTLGWKEIEMTEKKMILTTGLIKVER